MSKSTTGLEGRVVIVTGAGRGIGRAYVHGLAANGAYVVVNDLGVESDGTAPSKEPAECVVAEIQNAGGTAISSYDDVSDVQGARNVVATAIQHFGRLDAVVNNAGIALSGNIVDLDENDWKKVIDVHLTGQFLVARSATAYWRDRIQAGVKVEASIVNTTSPAGLYGFYGESAYSAAKAGILGFTLTAAVELAQYGVTVNAVAPGALTRLTEWVKVVPGPEFLAPLIAWLVGPDARDITGRVFEAYGGFVMVLGGWRPNEPIQYTLDTDPLQLGRELRERINDATPPMPVLQPGVNLPPRE